MSYDDNNIKSRNSQIYFNSIHRDKKRKQTNNNHVKFQVRPSKSNNKLDNKLFIQRRKQKQLTIGPLSSTLESTISSPKPQIDDDNSSLSSEMFQKITIKSKKLLQPKDDDIKFLFDIFYKNNNKSQFQNNQYNNNLNKNFAFYKNKFDFFAIKKYLIKMQKIFNINGNIIIYQNFHNKAKSSGDLMDYFHLQKLEDLIARYSLIIYIFIKSGKIQEAKKIFLIMITENINSMNNLEKKICSKYLVVNRKINIYKDIPTITYELAKIYSVIIKYSQLFNLSNYRNIFMDKYLRIQVLNYKFYMIKGTIRGFSAETRNQIKYFLCYCFHNCSYYTIYNYFPLKVPIIFNYNILSLYSYLDETSLTDLEKSLLIKTSYNEGLLYYINGQKDEALLSLNHSKEKIISFSDDYYANYNYNNIINNYKNNFINMFKKHVKENVIEINQTTKRPKKQSTINPFKIKYEERSTEKNKTIKISHKNSNKIIKQLTSISPKLQNSFDKSDEGKKSKDLSNTPKSKYDELKADIYNGFKKNKITIEDIELLVKFGKEKGLLNEEPTGSSKGLDFLFKYKESFSAIKKKITLPKGFRGSHIDFHTSIKIKDFFIPEKFKNPLLRKIELLMSLLELEKKNYVAAYEHVLNVLYIVFLLKLSNNYNYSNEFFNRKKFEINEYFKLIEDSYEKDIQEKQLLEKSSSKSIVTVNDKRSKSIISNLNSSINNFNNSFIIFENKDAENNFYQNLNNNNKNKNNDIKDYYVQKKNYNNKDTKIIKEFEKFFIFLNNLSLYQIKILNETQPDIEKRNHLPIMLANQFKDCLTRTQRLELDNLQTMALSRFMILKDPNKWIIPTNLNYKIIEKNNIPPINKRNSLHLNVSRYNFIDETFMKTKEYKNYLDIINSEKCTPDIKVFIKNNKNYVFKIIKESNDIEINNMIKYPYIIIGPIKEYKRRIKKYKKSLIENKSIIDAKKRPKTLTHSFTKRKIIQNPKNKYKMSNLYKKIDKRNKSTTGDLSQMKNSVNIKTNNNYNNYDINNDENNKFIKAKDKQIICDEKVNESFEDYLLSPENSSFNDKNDKNDINI